TVHSEGLRPRPPIFEGLLGRACTQSPYREAAVLTRSRTGRSPDGEEQVRLGHSYKPCPGGVARGSGESVVLPRTLHRVGELRNKAEVREELSDLRVVKALDDAVPEERK